MRPEPLPQLHNAKGKVQQELQNNDGLPKYDVIATLCLCQKTKASIMLKQ
jgi:hypothetical protein